MNTLMIPANSSPISSHFIVSPSTSDAASISAANRPGLRGVDA